MGVGIYLVGTGRKNSNQQQFSQLIADWTFERYGNTIMSAWEHLDEAANPVLLVQVHPNVPPVTFSWRDETTCTVHALSAGAGAGYHLFLCDYLRELGSELGYVWTSAVDDSDKSGQFNASFFSRDPDQAGNAILRWLKAQAQKSLSMCDTYSSFHWLLPDDYVYTHDSLIATPMGPRSESWLRAVATQPIRGIDLFSWWQPGQGSNYKLGKALTLMWTDVRWRPPISAEENDLLRLVLSLLEEAYKSVPDLEYPWREWQEIADYVGLSDRLPAEVFANAASQTGGSLIGYRRKPVALRMADGWSLRLPGDCGEQFDRQSAPGQRAWHFQNENITVWFTTFGTVEEDESGKRPSARSILEEVLPNALDQFGELKSEQKTGRLIKQIYASDEPAVEGVHKYTAVSATSGRLSLCHVFSRENLESPSVSNIFDSIRNENDYADGAGENLPADDLSQSLAEEDASIEDHVRQFIGPVENIIAETTDEALKVDVLVVAPTDEKPFYTLITSGMSSLPMSVPEGAEDYCFAELLLCLPADWPGAKRSLEEGIFDWPIHCLKWIARLPHEYDTWVGYSHTVPNGNPPQPLGDNTEMSCLLVSVPRLFPEEFLTLQRPDGSQVQFYCIVPIYREEMDYKLENGGRKLIDILAEGNVSEYLDPGRANLCSVSTVKD